MMWTRALSVKRGGIGISISLLRLMLLKTSTSEVAKMHEKQLPTLTQEVTETYSSLVINGEVAMIQNESKDAMDEFDARESTDAALTKGDYVVSGTLARDLNELCTALDISEGKAIALGIGVLLKAKDCYGEIRILDEKNNVVFRSKRIGKL